MFKQILVERDTEVPMRDGAILRADIYRPDSRLPVPAILIRLPYNKDGLGNQAFGIEAVRTAEAGFGVVIQDTRGRYKSDGDFYPFSHEGLDGFDTVEWLAAQPWCSGAVGMTGASYFGATQFLAAVEQPPHLKAIFPIITSSEYYEGWTYQGGAFQLGFTLLWTLRDLAVDQAQRLVKAGKVDTGPIDQLLLAAENIDEQYNFLPLLDLPILRNHPYARFYFDWLEHSSDDSYWQATAVNRKYPQVSVPAYHVGGWYDLFLNGTLENYMRLKNEGPAESVRKSQRLLIGPWAHGAFSGAYPGFDFGAASSAASVDLTAIQHRYFSHYLKNEKNGFDEEPPVRIFVMGENRWRDEQDWPLPRTKYEKWYLHSTVKAGIEEGILSTVLPADEAGDVYLYDPRSPVPTIGGPTFLPFQEQAFHSGPQDQSPLEARQDVLVYTSAVLKSPIEVTGPLVATLYASSSAVDTDFVMKLCDVYPDGASRLLAEGILRARFRENLEKPELLNPGQIYKFIINLVATSNIFKPGHRIRIDITSSSFPRFDRNPNTGNTLGTDGWKDMKPALQTIFHNAGHPSHILLPVIDKV